MNIINIVINVIILMLFIFNVFFKTQMANLIGHYAIATLDCIAVAYLIFMQFFYKKKFW